MLQFFTVNLDLLRNVDVPPTWTDPSERPKHWKRDIKSGTWKVRSLYRPGLVTIVVRDLARYKLDLVGVQKVKWDKGGTVRAGIIFFLWERT